MLFDSASAKRALQVKAGKASYRAKVLRDGPEYFIELGRKAHAASPSGRAKNRRQQAANEPNPSDELEDAETGTYVAPKDK